MVGLGFGPPEISQDFAVDGTFNYKLHYPTYAVNNMLLSVLYPHPRLRLTGISLQLYVHFGGVPVNSFGITESSNIF